MKKWILLVLISVMSVGVAADSAHAIFGGRAWRVTARQEGYGVFGLRRSKRKSASVEVKSQKEGLYFTDEELESFNNMTSETHPELGESAVHNTIGPQYRKLLGLEKKAAQKPAYWNDATWLHGYQTRGGQ